MCKCKYMLILWKKLNIVNGVAVSHGKNIGDLKYFKFEF